MLLLRRTFISIILVTALVVVSGCGDLVPENIGSLIGLGPADGENGFGGPGGPGAESPGDEAPPAGEPSEGRKPGSGGPAAGSSGAIIYVKSSPAGAADGSSWGDAFGDLQSALDAAADRGGAEIWVAAGTYLPSADVSGDPDPADPRTKTFQLRNGVAIYGGFPADAGDGIGPDSRDPDAHPTILSGDMNGSGTWDFDDVYHVIYNTQDALLDETAVLDGVTITGGHAHGQLRDGHGGGIYLEGKQDNPSRPTISNVTVTGNKAVGSGGGIYMFAAEPHFHRVTISENMGETGGGMFTSISSPEIFESSFVGNTAEVVGGAMYMERDSYPVLTDVKVADNYAISGGGLFIESGTAILTDVEITRNQAEHWGGGTSSDLGGVFVMRNVIISGNYAPWGGGGMHLWRTTARLSNVLITGNEGIKGGGILADTSALTMHHVTISGNRSEDAGGGLAYISLEPDQRPAEPFVVYNSIIWGNDAEGNAAGYTLPNVFIDAGEGAPEFFSSLIQGSGGSSGWNSGENYEGAPMFGFDGGGNIDADPQFIEPLPAEHAPIPGGDYRLSAGSPAIDAGSPDYADVDTAADLAGADRIIGPAPDMGAYEFDPDGG